MKLTISLLAAVLAGTALLAVLKPKSRAIEGSAREPYTNADVRTVNNTPLKLPLAEPRIEASKSKRELVLYSAGKAVRVYRIGLGSNPKDDKEVQGDGYTPEGEFYVCSKNPKSSYYLSLGLSYPNEEDADRGLRDKLILESAARSNRSLDSRPVLSALEHEAWGRGVYTRQRFGERLDARVRGLGQPEHERALRCDFEGHAREDKTVKHCVVRMSAPK